MAKDPYIRAIRNPRHISGIYNYCDGWCERCPLTLRCANFAIGQDLRKESTPHQRNKELLWPRLKACEAIAAELLAKHAEHPGVMPVKRPKFNSLRDEIDSSLLGAASKRYMEFAHTFVTKYQETLPAREPFAGGPKVTPAEAFDVIAWYHVLITVKLARALRRDELDDLRDDPEFAGIPSDQDGTGKVVLMSIDRSILAWAVLSVHVPELAAEAYSAMFTLNRLRRGIEKELPNARSFVRAGFDTLHFPNQDAHR